MLSQADNAILTRVGPGEPMGELLRRYWIPVLLSEELPTSNGDPLRVKLLGQTFVAWRDEQGRVGFFDEHCMHRGASLVLGRCEGDGLRCLYHGWKFSVTGEVLEMPNTPHLAGKARLRAPNYPVYEAGELIWVYLGPKEKQPPHPNYPFMSGPPEHRVLMRIILDCNWLQSVEGHLDSAHVGILHDDWNLFGRQVDSSLSQFVRSSTDISTEDDAPRIEVQETAHGFYSGAIRNASFRGNDASYARIHAFMVPWLSLVPPGMYAFEVPLNDHQVSYLLVTWDPDRRIDREEYRRRRCSSGAFVEEVPDNLVMRFTGTAENGWHQDRIRMRNGESFSGMSEFVSEDFAVTTSMGPILDRSREHLVPSDAAVVSMRRQLLRAAKNLQNGIEPPMMSTEESAQIRVSDGIIEPGQRWQDLLNACQANPLQNPTNPAGA